MKPVSMPIPSATYCCETRDPVLRIALTQDIYRRQVMRAVATMRAWASEERSKG